MNGNVLWLVSWYPSLESPQNGDFIYRHALSVSPFANLTILYCNSSTKVSEMLVIKRLVNEKFKEEVLLFPRRQRFGVLNFLNYCYFYNRQITKLYKDATLPDIIHVHVSFRAGLLALYLKWKYNIPYIITEHWTFYTRRTGICFTNSNFIKKWILRRVFKNASYVLPVSHDLSRQLDEYFPSIKSIVVPNVVDATLFNFISGIRPSNRFKFIHVSSLNELKNPDQIILAFNRIRQVYKEAILEIVGPANSKLVRYAESLGLRDCSILFVGLKSHREVASLMQASNALVLFSSAENLPCVIAESLCSGVPVISSSVGGVPEMVNDSNGILVPSGDEGALYQAMESMIVNYSKYNRRRISEDAQAKYNPEVVGRQILDVYERVLSKK